jgi:hypothetical protein
MLFLAMPLLTIGFVSMCFPHQLFFASLPPAIVSMTPLTLLSVFKSKHSSGQSSTFGQVPILKVLTV